MHTREMSQKYRHQSELKYLDVIKQQQREKQDLNDLLEQNRVSSMKRKAEITNLQIALNKRKKTIKELDSRTLDSSCVD